MTAKKPDTCINCIHRRPLTPLAPYGSVCHYLLDTGEQRGCPPERCTRWREAPENTEKWLALLRRMEEASK